MLVKRLMLLIALPLFAIPVALLAQDEEEEKGHVWTISTYKVNFNDIEGLLEMWEEDQGITTENEFVLSSKVLTHLWGPDWTIMIIAEYAKFEDIAAATAKRTELFEKKYTSETRRKARTKKIRALFQGHTDAIVQENPKLTK